MGTTNEVTRDEAVTFFNDWLWDSKQFDGERKSESWERENNWDAISMIQKFAELKLKEQEETQPKFSLDFIKWYSGMKEEQILNAHKRWIKEENNGK